MDWSLIISLLAIVVSLLIGWFTYRQHKKSNELQGRIVSLEEDREEDRKREKLSANVKAFIGPSQSIRGNVERCFILRNEGNSEAKNIRGYINGKALHKSDDVFIENNKIEVLGANSEITLPLISGRNSSTGQLWKVKIIWDDGVENGREFNSTITAY